MRQEMMGFGMQWHQLGHMQTICASLQTDNYTNTPSLNFLQAEWSSCRPTNNVKALNVFQSTEGIACTSKLVRK